MTPEQQVIHVLDKGTSLGVVNYQIDCFTRTYGFRPELVVLSPKLRISVLRELINQIGLLPEAAVLEPVFLNGIPVIFRALPDQAFLSIVHRGQKKEVTL
jgi:hypothetical protein